MSIELIGIVASLLSIVASILAIKSYKRIGITFLVVSFIVLVFLIIFLIHQSVGLVYTKIEKFEHDSYSGVQHHYYHTPFVFGESQLPIFFHTKKEKAPSNAPASYKGFGISSHEIIEELDEETNTTFDFLKKSMTQYFAVTYFTNAFDIATTDQGWDQPKGWGGFTYENSKVNEGKEIIFILDFSNLKTENNELNIPRYLVSKDGKEPDSDYQNEELILNEFSNFKIMPNTNNAIFFARLKTTSEPLVLIRWKK